MGNLVKKIFTQDDMQAIAAAIGTAEKTTIGEIRVSIRQKRKWTERTMALEILARKEFDQLGMSHTKERTGILIFLLVSEKQFYIYADEGINSKVDPGTWESVARRISDQFSKKNFRHGIIDGVKEVGTILTKYFPSTSSDTNELSNEVRVS